MHDTHYNLHGTHVPSKAVPCLHQSFFPTFITISVLLLSRFPPRLHHDFFPTSPKACFSSSRETCSLFQWERKMFLVFSFQSHVVHLHSAICDAAKQIGVVAVYQVGEMNNLIRFLIAKGVKMGREHHRHVHLIEFGRQSLLHVIRSVPFLKCRWNMRKHN